MLRLTPTRKEPTARMGSRPVLDFIQTSFAIPSRVRYRAPGRGALCRRFGDVSSPSGVTPEGTRLFAASGEAFTSGGEQATNNKQEGAGGGHVACCVALVAME
jgi:hypothetical protein